MQLSIFGAIFARCQTVRLYLLNHNNLFWFLAAYVVSLFDRYSYKMSKRRSHRMNSDPETDEKENQMGKLSPNKYLCYLIKTDTKCILQTLKGIMISG